MTRAIGEGNPVFASGDRVRVRQEKPSGIPAEVWALYGGHEGDVVGVFRYRNKHGVERMPGSPYLVLMLEGPLTGEQRWFSANELESMDRKDAQ